MHKTFTALAVALLLLAYAAAQDQKMPADADTHDMSAMHDMPGMGSDGSAHAMHSMEGHHMDMGPHMKMTALRDPQPGDEEKAAQVVDAARKAAEKYKD